LGERAARCGVVSHDASACEHPSRAADTPERPSLILPGRSRVHDGRRRCSKRKMLRVTLASSAAPSGDLPCLHAGQGGAYRAASRGFRTAGDESALGRARALAGVTPISRSRSGNAVDASIRRLVAKGLHECRPAAPSSLRAARASTHYFFHRRLGAAASNAACHSAAVRGMSGMSLNFGVGLSIFLFRPAPSAWPRSRC
jgi:hypothetical protein